MFSKVMLAMDLTEVTPQIMEAFYSVCPASETEVYLLHVVEDAASAEASSKYYKKNYSRLKGLAQDIKNAGYDLSLIHIWCVGRLSVGYFILQKMLKGP